MLLLAEGRRRLEVETLGRHSGGALRLRLPTPFLHLVEAGGGEVEALVAVRLGLRGGLTASFQS